MGERCDMERKMRFNSVFGGLQAVNEWKRRILELESRMSVGKEVLGGGGVARRQMDEKVMENCYQAGHVQEGSYADFSSI